MTLLSEAFMVAIILVVTLWRRDIFLYIVSCPLLIGFGLNWYVQDHTWTGFIISIVVMGIGIYCLVMGGYNLIRSKGD